MIKKILILTIIILVLVAIAIGIQIYFDQSENTPIVQDETESPGGIFGFLGFGDNPETIVNTEEPQADIQERPTFIPTLRKISEDPVAGSTFVGTASIRYVDRGTGHVYEDSVDSYDLKKISNTTFPKVYTAYWLENGEKIILQQLEENILKTKLIGLEDGTSTEVLRGVSVDFLPDNIKHLTVAPETDEFAYLEKTDDADGKLSIANGDITNTISLPGSEWIVDWPETNTFSVTSKASFDSPGYNYSLGRSGSLSKNLGAVDGLTTKSNSRWIIYSDSNNLLTLNSLDLETGSSTPLRPTTLPEKCVFVSENDMICGSSDKLLGSGYPDIWYKGLVSLNDDIVSYNLETSQSEIIYTPGEDVDLIDPKVSSDAKYLMFTNKKDLSLWVLNIAEAQSF